jgi:hypothetical protein
MRSITIPRITAITVLLLFAMWAHEPVPVADAAVPPPAAFVRTSDSLTVAPTNRSFGLYTNGVELVRVGPTGRIYMKGKEVHTDPEYRAAMMALMRGAMGCQP